MFRFLLLTLVVAVTTSAPVFAQSPPYHIASPPSWVDSVPLPEAGTIPTDEISDGVYYLRIDEQHRVDGRSREVFQHTAYQIVNSQGIKNGAQVSVEFDPTYQKLTLHFVRVRRQGDVLDRLDPAAINILQRETELEYLIFDGTLTASMILEDIQAGDIVEYAYTITGDNPIFEGIYSAGFTTRFDVPVRERTFRVLWPEGRTLHVRSHGAEVEPILTSGNGYTAYRWRLEDVPALVVDDELPYWYNPYPWIQLSEWESWEAVAAWGRTLFDRVDLPSEALHEEVRRITAGHATPHDRLAAALRFTQDDIRYMGIEIGINSHEPRSPAEVLSKRFGDCKDKSLLLVAMLREMGIEAHPVLVNTIDAREMTGWLPAGDLFDHAIVRARIGDTAYWFDPTSTLQRGAADVIFQPDYDQVLVLEPGADALTPMHPPRLDVPFDDIAESFDFSAGFDEPVAYTIQGTYRGESADYMRNLFAGKSRLEMERDFLNYYADLYPTITPAASMSVEDDEASNEFRVTEHYLIDRIWTPNPGDTPYAVFYPLDFSSFLETPESRIRTMPFGLSHPVHIRQTTTVRLPENRTIEPVSERIEDPAFVYDFRIASEENQIVITHTYQSRTDAIPPENLGMYLRNIQLLEDHLSFELPRREDRSLAIGIFSALGLLVVGWIMYTLLRRRPARRLA